MTQPNSSFAVPRIRAVLRPVLAPVLIFSAAINVLMLTGSVYMLQVYDRVLSSQSVPTLLGLFAIVVVLFCFLGLFDMLRMRLLSRAGLRLDRRLGRGAFRATLAGKGTLGDLETMRAGIASPATTAMLDLPFVPLYLSVLFLLHPWLGWLTVAGAGIAAAFAVIGRAVSARSGRQAAASEATERDLLEGSRRAAETVTALGMTAPLADRWRHLRDGSLAAGQTGSDPAESLSAASRTFRLFLQSAILTLGGLLVLRGEISAGMIIASSILSGRTLQPIDQITGQWRTLGRMAEARRRLAAALAEIEDTPETIDLPEPEGRLEVHGLARMVPARPGAREGAERARILSDLDFDLSPGDALGVIGTSASGKTTLARLLVGVLAPDAGEVRLSGATLDQWPEARRGRLIGYLPQRVEFLPGTVRANIARFEAGATDEAVIAAARLAGVHEMILRLPEGYGTQIGSPVLAPPLSGGQLQRLALARALYGMPPLVVLDEPNSNLDLTGEAALADAIRALRKAGSAVVVMAHRPSVLAVVNKLMILEGGRANAFGDKADVLALAREDAAGPRPAIAAPAPAAVHAPAPAGTVRFPAPAARAALAPPMPAPMPAPAPEPASGRTGPPLRMDRFAGPLPGFRPATRRDRALAAQTDAQTAQTPAPAPARTRVQAETHEDAPAQAQAKRQSA